MFFRQWLLIRLAAADRNGPQFNYSQQYSQKSKDWLFSLTQIKLDIDLTARDIIDNSALIFAEKEKEFLDQLLRKHSETFDAWLNDVKNASSITGALNIDKALKFIIEGHSNMIWRLIYLLFSNVSTENNYPKFEKARSSAALFAKLGAALYDKACDFDVEDLSKLSEIITAIQTKLSGLECLCLLSEKTYGNHWDKVLGPEWVSKFQAIIISKQENNQKKENITMRSPLQRYHDNLLLQAIVAVTVLGCIYPLFRTMTVLSPTHGSKADDNFWSQTTNSIMQFAGFITLLLPIYRETAAKEWIGTWILTSFGTCSALAAIPLYLLVPVSWSVLLSWIAASCQLLVVLQVALVAAFHEQDRPKKEQ